MRGSRSPRKDLVRGMGADFRQARTPLDREGRNRRAQGLGVLIDGLRDVHRMRYPIPRSDGRPRTH